MILQHFNQCTFVLLTQVSLLSLCYVKKNPDCTMCRNISMTHSKILVGILPNCNHRRHMVDTIQGWCICYNINSHTPVFINKPQG